MARPMAREGDRRRLKALPLRPALAPLLQQRRGGLHDLINSTRRHMKRPQPSGGGLMRTEAPPHQIFSNASRTSCLYSSSLSSGKDTVST